MPADASIYGMIRQPEAINPLAQLAQVQQIQGLQNQNRAQQMQFDQAQRAQAEQNKLADLVRSWNADTTDDQRISALKNSGFFQQADTLDKARTERVKTDAAAQEQLMKATKQRLDIAGQAFGAVLANPTLENAHAVLDYLGQNGIFKPEQVQQYKQMTAANPGNIAQLADQAFRASLDAKEQLAKVETKNTGGQTVTQAIDPVTGQVRTINTIQNTQSPDNAATVGAQYAKLQEERRHNSVIESQGGANKPPTGYRWAADGKTLEAIPGGPAGKDNATEGERKAATLLKRLESSQAQLNAALESNPKATKPGMIPSLLEGMGADAAANVMNSPARQRIEAAQLDMLDAALTLGTGAAYTKEQLQGYRKSYFPQIGDDPATIRDKQARLLNVIDAAKIAAGRAAKQVTTAPAAPAAAEPPKVVDFGSLK